MVCRLYLLSIVSFFGRDRCANLNRIAFLKRLTIGFPRLRRSPWHDGGCAVVLLAVPFRASLLPLRVLPSPSSPRPAAVKPERERAQRKERGEGE